MKKLLRNRAGTAEIVGTVLFLVILFFFFSNVFLWHNQVTREIDQVIADKTNSAVRIETTATTGGRVYGDDYPAVIEYATTPDDKNHQLQADYSLNTGMDTPQKRRLISAVHLSVDASYEDFGEGEVCYIYVYDFKGGQWLDTGLRVTREPLWLNVTLSQGSRYVGTGGLVQIEFKDSSSISGTPDVVRGGVLEIDYIEVTVDVVALQVTDLGGLDAPISRLWIINSADHIYAELEPLSVPAGSHRDIIFSMAIVETELNPDGSVKALTDADGVVINYVPPSGQTVIFRVLTKLGNTAACGYSFPMT